MFSHAIFNSRASKHQALFSPYTIYSGLVNYLFGSSVIVGYWPLWEPAGTSGANSVKDQSVNAYNATPSGVTFGQTGIGDKGLNRSVSFPGTASYIDISSCRAAINSAEGSIIIWSKLTGVGVWTDGIKRMLFNAYVDANNQLAINKEANNNQLYCMRRAGGVSKGFFMCGDAIGWLMVGLTWSKSGDYVRSYLNGSQYGADQISLATFTGTPTTTQTCIGQFNTGSTYPFSGNLAHTLILNRPATASEMRQLYTFVASPKIVSVLGDSVPTEAQNNWKWTSKLRDNYSSGKIMIINHSVSGALIVHDGSHADLADLAATAPNDQADIIIIALGTNDNNAGNMTTLQASAEAGIQSLKASNPRATIYWQNVLPRWTDTGGATPVDKAAVRTAIAAACTAQSITCWDSFTTPWIAASETIDGLHPSDAGHAKMATKIISLLP